MLNLVQHTLKTGIKAKGVALHRGEITEVTLRPAPANTGIVFRLIDATGAVDIRAVPLAVQETLLNTTLVKEGKRVATIEHLMSAFAATGVDNAYVDISGSDELPIMDGSAAPYLCLIQSAGLEAQSRLRRFLRINREVVVRQGDKWAKLTPYDGFRLSFTIDFKHPLFTSSVQHAEFEFSPENYIKEVGRARTFGFMSEFEQLRERGLAKGASLDNAVAIDEYRVLNKDGLRYEDECVRHKILDAIGDLYVLGYPIIGAFAGYKSGHALNNVLLRELLASENAFEFVEFGGSQQPPRGYLNSAQVSFA